MAEIRDFAAALRGMADNVDIIADRHDVTEVVRLRESLDEHMVRARRDGDLIDELRRHAEIMGRRLDAIGKLRRNALVGERAGDVVEILADALLLIAEDRCASFTTPEGCLSPTTGRVRGAKFGAEAWCDACIARDALVRAGYRGES